MKTNERNIKIIVLVLTILILIIGIMLINNTGILKKIGKNKEQMLEKEATAKLEQALEIAKTKKETDENYNSAEYLEKLLKEQSIGIYGNIAIVNDYNFEIDRENLSVTQTIGKTNVSLETKVVKLLEKSANGKQRAEIEIMVTSNTPLDNIIFENEDGTFDKQKAEELTYKKKMEIELDKDYVITMVGKDGKLSKKIFRNTKDDYQGPGPGESGHEGGTYNDPYVPVGFKHTEGTWNSGYTIIGETASIGNEFVWVPCVLTIAEQNEARSNGDVVQIFQRVLSYPKNSSIEVKEEMASADYIRASVGKYEGFYIAKYEAGIPGTNKSPTSNHKTSVAGDILPVSKANVGVWNYITINDAVSLSNKMISYEETGVYSTLISGTAWDTTLQWITNTTDSDYATTTIIGKGNYSKTLAVTSSNFNRAYAKNNIYDMAGNVYEFTTEFCKNNSSSERVVRGRLLYL